GDRLDTAALADSQLIELLARDAAELAHVVAAEEGIAGVRQLIAAVERDAGRGDGARAGAVDRRDIASVAAGAGDGRPAVVAAPPDDVDLIGAGRPVLGRQEVAGDRIEGQAERVAQAVSEDRRAGEGIIGWDGAVRVNAQDLAA